MNKRLEKHKIDSRPKKSGRFFIASFAAHLVVAAIVFAGLPDSKKIEKISVTNVELVMPTTTAKTTFKKPTVKAESKKSVKKSKPKKTRKNKLAKKPPSKQKKKAPTKPKKSTQKVSQAKAEKKSMSPDTEKASSAKKEKNLSDAISKMRDEKKAADLHEKAVESSAAQKTTAKSANQISVEQWLAGFLRTEWSFSRYLVKDKTISAVAHVTIKPDGNVTEAFLKRKSNDKAFDASVEKVLAKLQKSPLPPGRTISVDIEFNLKDFI